MSDWQVVHDGRAERPAEIDTASSETTVYLRRNIRRVMVQTEMSEEAHEEWEYEQKELTNKEYISMQDAQIAQHTADIDYIAMETGVEL